MFGQQFLLILFVILVLVLFLAETTTPMTASSSTTKKPTVVQIHHLVVPSWTEPHYPKGLYTCGNIQCNYSVASNMEEIALKQRRRSVTLTNHSTPKDVVTVAIFQQHFWSPNTVPAKCIVDLTLGEMYESMTRLRSQNIFHYLGRYDGQLSTHPSATIQNTQYYIVSSFTKANLVPLRPYNKLIRAVAFIHSNCDGLFYVPSRNDVVKTIRAGGFPVHGLGRCLHSTEFVMHKNMTKHQAINHYAFTFAFENTLEEGYVTEKLWDALCAGSVPIYHGDPHTVKQFLPDPQSVIFFDNFNRNATALALFLSHLVQNETRYELYRAWRKDFNFDHYYQNHPLLTHSFPCKVCEWAVNESNSRAQSHPRKFYPTACHRDFLMKYLRRRSWKKGVPLAGDFPFSLYPKSILPKQWEGMYYEWKRGSYALALDGAFHRIPDVETWSALGFYQTDQNRIPKQQQFVITDYRRGVDVPSVLRLS